MSDNIDAEVELALEGPDKISITFPPGTKAALRKRVSLKRLLGALAAPAESEVDAYQEAQETTFIPGSG